MVGYILKRMLQIVLILVVFQSILFFLEKDLSLCHRKFP